MWLSSTPQWKLCWNVAFGSILLAIPPLWLHGDHSKFYLCDFVVYRVLFNSPFSSHHNPARYVDIVFPITNCFFWYKSQFVPVLPEAPSHPSMCLVDGEQEGGGWGEGHLPWAPRREVKVELLTWLRGEVPSVHELLVSRWGQGNYLFFIMATCHQGWFYWFWICDNYCRDVAEVHFWFTDKPGPSNTYCKDLGKLL